MNVAQRAVLVGVALMMFIATTCLVGSANAAPSTCGSGVNSFDGYGQNPSGTFINGIEVVLKLRNWGYCTSAGAHADSEWVMVSPIGSNGWVQVGYEHHSSGFYDFFWQVNDGSGPVSGVWGSRLWETRTPSRSRGTPCSVVTRRAATASSWN